MLSKAEWAAGSMARPKEGRLRCDSDELEAERRWAAFKARPFELAEASVVEEADAASGAVEMLLELEHEW